MSQFEMHFHVKTNLRWRPINLQTIKTWDGCRKHKLLLLIGLDFVGKWNWEWELEQPTRQSENVRKIERKFACHSMKVSTLFALQTNLETLDKIRSTPRGCSVTLSLALFRGTVSRTQNANKCLNIKWHRKQKRHITRRKSIYGPYKTTSS